MDFVAGGRERAAVHGWSFDVQLRLGVSANTMFTRHTPLAAAAPVADFPWKRPVTM
jgi:hypothetical protein